MSKRKPWDLFVDKSFSLPDTYFIALMRTSGTDDPSFTLTTTRKTLERWRGAIDKALEELK